MAKNTRPSDIKKIEDWYEFTKNLQILSACTKKDQELKELLKLAVNLYIDKKFHEAREKFSIAQANAQVYKRRELKTSFDWLIKNVNIRIGATQPQQQQLPQQQQQQQLQQPEPEKSQSGRVAVLES